MTKLDFMKELEENLSDIPLEERKEALSFYENYFEDAGPEQEQNIISELGSPAKVATSIKANLVNSEEGISSRGYFTEKGYEDDSLSEPKFEIIGGMSPTKYHDTNKEKISDDFEKKQDTNSQDTNKEKQNSYNDSGFERKNNGSGNIILMVILGIFAAPILIAILASVFSVALAIIATIGGLWLGFVCMTIGLICAGIALIVASFIKFFTLPAVGVCLAGAGLIVIGISLILGIAVIKITQFIPVILRFFVNICRLPFRNRRVTA